jgi:phenazine biosynthesis protein phzE
MSSVDLTARNEGLSEFWRDAGPPEAPALAGRRVLIIDAEDDFTAMLARLTEALGPEVRIDTKLNGEPDLVIVGPGPGDPRDLGDPRIARLHEITRGLLAAGTPFLAVCLGHQVLADELGLPIRRLARPAQGLQRVVELFGRPERVGFYNTFAAIGGGTAPPGVQLLCDPRDGAVHAMRMPRARSIQFHVESVLTEHGPAILRRMLTEMLSEAEGAIATWTTSGQ